MRNRDRGEAYAPVSNKKQAQKQGKTIQKIRNSKYSVSSKSENRSIQSVRRRQSSTKEKKVISKGPNKSVILKKISTLEEVVLDDLYSIAEA